MANLQTKGSTSLIEGQDVLLSEEISIFLLDVSSSMSDRIEDDGSFELAWDDRCSKFGAMKRAAMNFIEQRVSAIRNGSTDHVGIITFGDDVKLLHDPSSNNFDSLLNKLKSMRACGSTPMAEAINLAIQTAERFTTGMIRVIICSDGQPDYKPGVINNVIRGFEEYGIIFDTIGIGNLNDRWGLDEDFLKEVANSGGGEYTFISSFQEFTKKFLLIEGERQLLLGKGILMLPGK